MVTYSFVHLVLPVKMRVRGKAARPKNSPLLLLLHRLRVACLFRYCDAAGSGCGGGRMNEPASWESVFNLYITRYLKRGKLKRLDAVGWTGGNRRRSGGGYITMMCLQFKFMRNGEVINVIIMTVVNIGFIAIHNYYHHHYHRQHYHHPHHTSCVVVGRPTG